MRADRLRWKNDPIAYFEERLKIKVWDAFRDIAASVRDNIETVWRSGNGLGKTHFLAALTCWWLDTSVDEFGVPDEGMVFTTTGGSFSSLEDSLWPRIRQMRDEFDLFPNAKKNLDLKILITNKIQAFARSTDKGVNIQGMHSKRLLQIIDEADGMSLDIANAIYGNAKGDKTRIIWCGNPTSTEGHFYNMFSRNDVKNFHTSSLDHPNVKEGREVIEGAVTRKNLERDAELPGWGTRCSKDTPGAIYFWWCDRYYLPTGQFGPRILGEPPIDSQDSLFPRDLVERAMENGKQPLRNSTISHLGCDIAESDVGDETVIAIGNETGILPLECRTGIKPDETTGRINDIRKTYKLRSIAIDAVGIGSGPYYTLKTMGLPIVPFKAGESVEKEESKKAFGNLKAEWYFAFLRRLQLDPLFALPDDPILKRQLLSIKKKYSTSGMLIEPKSGGESPDRAEACIILNYALSKNVGGYIPKAYRQAYDDLMAEKKAMIRNSPEASIYKERAEQQSPLRHYRDI
jgi:hypothetical protein